jgi:hypothetical protein
MEGRKEGRKEGGRKGGREDKGQACRTPLATLEWKQMQDKPQGLSK